jgi:hypothetical protein
MRVEAGCFRAKDGRDGSKVYLHRLANGPRSEVDLPPRSGPEAKRADVDFLHAVYSGLIARLTLSKAHRVALHRRGLVDDAIDRAGYRTLPRQGRARVARELHETLGDKLLHVPGFVVKDAPPGRYLTFRGPAGLVVPCRDRSGRILALKVRRDDVDGSGPRYLYCSSTGHGGPGPGAPVHCPVGTPEAAEVVRLTEGELKSDVVQALTGLPTVSVPGVGTWRPALGVLQAMGCKTVRLAFDVDAWDNPTVARALAGCADALAKAGFAVELERWAAADGKGLDDVLAAGKAPEVLTGDHPMSAIRDMVAAVTADEEPPPPDELVRLKDVLDAGGAEALFRDKPLLQVLADLAGTDPAGFAAVRASIRERVKVRDLDQALRPFRRPAAPGEGGGAPPYFEEHGYTYRNVLTRDGPVPVALSNFTARIIEEVEHDDGAEKTRFLAVEGTLADGSTLPRDEVAAADFARMDWVVPTWGTRAVVYAGMGTRDHLRTALQLLSGAVPRRTVFRHTGWRRIEENWVYLHAGGAIGADGLDADVPVLLPDALSEFRLPAPSEGPALAAAIRASLGLLRLGPDHLTFPLLAVVYRAVLGDTDFSKHLVGPTGSYKTEAATLAEQHFGAGMDARHLPANWSSTGNALEALAFTAKDALLVVDDFCPTGSAADVQRYHREADRLLRGQGNRAGRQRMRADATLRPAKPPRGLVLSTGEDTPRGQSLRARLLVEEISLGDFGPPPPAPNPILTALQQDAAAGKFAAALSGYVRWLAPQYDAIRGRMRAELADLRDRARADGQHARTPGIVADLALSLRYLLDFARAAGAISEEERADLWERGWAALAEAGAAQAAQIATAEPAGLFVRLLVAAVASGRAHLADPQGNAPDEPERWGWRPRQIGMGEHATIELQPQGRRIGWIDDGNVYLEPDASYAEAQRLAQEEGDSLPVTSYTLRRRLNEKKLLDSTETARGKLTIRRTFQGARFEVLHIAWPGITATATAGSSGPASTTGADPGPEARAGSRSGNGQANGEAAHDTAAAGTAGHSPAVVGPELGRLGRSHTGGEGAAGSNNHELPAGRPRPPQGARLCYQDSRGRPCPPAEAATWCWVGGPRWYNAVTEPPESAA